VDLCRQSIIFDSVADLALCLRVMEDDPEVHLVRIKNRMDPSYPPLLSGGYRDLSVNLKVVSAQTKGLGLATHVCEVQLILKRFAEVKVCRIPHQPMFEVSQAAFCDLSGKSCLFPF
jgi:hypothetical protein